MLLAHLVPGYFAAALSQPRWQSHWRTEQRALLWAVALGSTFAPDLDVIYNLLFRGFINHSLLWTHSLWPQLSLGVLWWLLWRTGRWPYLQTLLWLAVIGGLSHLVLDVIVHGTPLFYPLSLAMIGYPPARVVVGGFWAYITDPIFLGEPLLWTLLIIHWGWKQAWLPFSRTRWVVAVAASFLLLASVFLYWLLVLQSLI